MDLDIYILPDGTIRYVHADELEDVFREDERDTRRASHVEPSKDGWTADLGPVGGPVLGPYRSRKEALAAEADWLRDRLETGTLAFAS